MDFRIITYSTTFSRGARAARDWNCLTRRAASLRGQTLVKGVVPALAAPSPGAGFRFRQRLGQSIGFEVRLKFFGGAEHNAVHPHGARGRDVDLAIVNK